jgi:hypothetical protein
VNKIIFIVLLFVFKIQSNAQNIPVWYKNHHVDVRKVNFEKYIKKNFPFSFIKVVDTIRIPSAISIMLLDKEGKFLQEFDWDSAAYCASKEFIIAGKKENGKTELGVFNLKGEVIIPMEYSEIRFDHELFALKNQNFLWALVDSKGNKITGFDYIDMGFTAFGKIEVKNQGGVGIMDFDGRILVENKYSEIIQVALDSFIVKEHDYWECIDKQKKLKFRWIADSLKALNDTVILSYQNGRVFIKDTLGQFIGFKNGYDKAEKISDKFIQVSLGQYWGLITYSGKEILPTNFYTISVDTAGYIKALGDEIKVLRYSDVVNKNKKRWSLYDFSGNKILNKQYKSIRSYQEGMIAVQNDESRWGFADEKGTLVIEPKYTYVSDFKNGKALVKLPEAGKNDYRLIDKKEKKLYTGREAQLFYLGVIRYRNCSDTLKREGEPETELYYGVPPDRYDCYSLAEYGYVRVKNGTYTGVLTPEGREVVQAYQDTVYRASADTIFLYKRNNGLVGFADRYCNTTLNLTGKFEMVQPLQEGYSKFKKDGLFGFMDAYGNVPIAPKYSACTEFYDGMVAVFLKGKWGFIDKQENLTVQPYYKEVKPFRHGFAQVKNNSNKWIFINKNGVPVNTTLYDQFRKVKNEKYIVIKNKNWGITYANGKEILSPKYEYLEEMSDTLIKVKKDGKYGVMDYQENIILYYQYDDVIYHPYKNYFFVKTKGNRRKIKVPFVQK